MMTVDDTAGRFGTDLVELITESCHVGCGVFVARDHLVNRVNDYGRQVFSLYSPHQPGNQLIHRDGPATEVPDQNVVCMQRLYAESLVNLQEPVNARRRVNFQIHIQYFALPALEAKPGKPFGNRDAQLHQQEGFSGLGGTGDQHFVSLTQDSFYQFLREHQLAFLKGIQCAHGRELVGFAVDVIHPIKP